MRILIVSFRYPPANSIGAVRISKFSRLFQEMGAEVRVLTASGQGLPENLPVEIDEAAVTRLPWVSDDGPFQRIAGKENKGGPSTGTPSLKGRIKGALLRAYVSFRHWPDNKRGWANEATRRAESLIADWRPDVIYASAHPLSSLIAADQIARQHGIPWVGELRDPWIGNLYAIPLQGWREAKERVWEKEVVSRAHSFVVVTEGMREELHARTGKPIHLIVNGYDEKDFPERTDTEEDPIFRVIYTGEIYGGRRDPRTVLDGLKLLSPEDRAAIRVEFYGREHQLTQQWVDERGLGDIVSIHPPIAYQESLAKQARAGALLLLTVDHPSEKGVYTGKLFEYIGAARPILVTGAEQGGASQLVRDRELGAFAKTPEDVARILSEWRRTRPQPDREKTREFTRQTQAQKLYALLEEAAQSKR